MLAWLLVIWVLTLTVGIKYYNVQDIIVGATCLSLEVLDEYYAINNRPKWKNIIVLVLCGAIRQPLHLTIRQILLHKDLL